MLEEHPVQSHALQNNLDQLKVGVVGMSRCRRRVSHIFFSTKAPWQASARR